MITIYKITSPSNKIYIGQTWNIKRRLSEYKRHQCKDQTKLFNSLEKYGFSNHKFEILREFQTNHQLIADKLEIAFWFLYKLHYDMLNVKEPGKGGLHSEETKRKIGLANKGKTRKLSVKHRANIGKGLLGRIQSEECKSKISQAHQGMKHSAETKEKMKGRIFTEEHKRKLSLAHKGKTYTAEYKANMSKIKTGHKLSEETKRKIGLANKKRREVK